MEGKNGKKKKEKRLRKVMEKKMNARAVRKRRKFIKVNRLKDVGRKEPSKEEINRVRKVVEKKTEWRNGQKEEK